MDNNYLKYLKYKKKLKKNNSKYINSCGKAALEENIFRLYTTGIGNWLEAYEGNTSNQNISQYYEIFKENIFSQIFENFPGYQISISHFDPLIIEEISQEKVDLQEKNIEFIKELSVKERQLPGIISSNFYDLEFNENVVDISEPHLILDFAHIFSYTENPDIQQLGVFYHQDRSNSRNIVNLNVLRFGFLGDIIAQVIFRVNPLFIVENGSIVTLTKIIQRKLPILISQNYLEDPIMLFFEKVVRNDFSTDYEYNLKRVESIKSTIIRKLEQQGIIFAKALDIVNANFEMNIDLITEICQMLVIKILNDKLPIDLTLNQEGRNFLRNLIDEISERVLNLINMTII
tara:strand:- start:4864 stop:5901 length:1038 start_codon:yes stop_codon:yes gene_type:complete